MTAKIKSIPLLFFLIHGAFLYAHQDREPSKDFFTLGLLSSADSIKTSVNLEVGITIYTWEKFQMRSLTSISGSKIFDDNPNLYQLALMEKLTFGQIDFYSEGVSSSRYGFFFTSFGFMSFNGDTSSKFLFSPPYFWEIGGGAGANIRLSPVVALIAEVGGGLHLVGNGKEDFIKKLQKAGFGRMSLGFRYFL